MRGECFGEALVFFDQRFLEIDDADEGIFFQECPARIDHAAVVVFVAPPAGDVEILHRKTEWVQPGVAPGAIGVFPVHGELFADGQVFRGLVFFQRRDIVRRRVRRVVEDDFDNPRSARDGVSPIRARGHAGHGGGGDDSAVAGIRGCHAPEGSGVEFVFDRYSFATANSGIVR